MATNSKNQKIETVIPIKGMHCKSCSILVNNVLKDLDGVEEVEVSLVDDEAKVIFNSKKTSQEEIEKEINNVGYGTPLFPTVTAKENQTFMQGLIYGLVPHIGCIGFIAFTIIGATTAMNFFKPLLMNRYFFHILILISLGFATLSSTIYLKQNGLLSWKGVKKKRQYLMVMFGTTISINLILFLVIFPVLANVNGDTGSTEGLATFRLKVDIPCPGHAPLIIDELKTVQGVGSVKYVFPDYFDVYYDASQTTKEEMMNIEVFTPYPCEEIQGSSQNEKEKLMCDSDTNICDFSQLSDDKESQPKTTTVSKTKGVLRKVKPLNE